MTATASTAAGSGTLALVESGAIYRLEGGTAMLFAQGTGANATRRPIGTVPEGGFLFGAEPEMLSGEHLVAVPSNPAGIVPAAPDLLAGATPDLTDGVRAWIGTLARGIGSGVEPKPRPDLLLPNGGHGVPVPAGAVIACHDAPVWVDLGGAGAELCGLERVDGLVPLAPGAWLVMEGAATVRALDWADGFEASDWREGVERFTDAALAILPIIRGFAEADELNRIREQDLAEARDARRAAARLAMAVDARAAAQGETLSEGLIDIVRLIAAREGLEVRRPTPARAQQDVPPTLDEISRASGFRIQPVRLDGAWWRDDLGSLVATLADGQAGALLRERRGYRLIDENGTEHRVDAEVAATIAAEAYALMPRYPAGALSLPALMSLSGRGGARDLWGFFGAVVAGGVLGQALPRATGFIFGQLVPSSMVPSIIGIAIGVVAVGFVAMLFQLALGIARQRIDARSASRSYAALWDRVLALPLERLTARGPAEMAVHAQSVLSVETGFRGLLTMVAASAAMLVSALVLILSRQPTLGLLVGGFVVLQLAMTCVVGWLQARAEKNGPQLEGNAEGMLFQMIGGVSKLRTAAAERRAMLRWTDRFAIMRHRRVAVQRIANLYESWLAGFAVLAAAGLFAVIATLATPSQERRVPVAISDVLLVLSAFAVALNAITQLVRGLLGLWLQKPSWAYAKQLLEEPPESLIDRLDPGPLRGSIDVSNVGFRYRPDSPPVLAQLSFSIQPGQFVAVVGASGSGKSTLIRILLGLAQPNVGAVYIDGHDVQSLHPEALRRQVGVVLQDMQPPSGSIAEVVRGLSHAQEPEIWSALEAAALDRDVAAMPMGLHTLVTDGGGTLSGGQKQRLALARVLLQRPAILLLDEATSALDAETQARAMASVVALPATRVVIAHRMSTVRDADLILVLDGGRIVQAGRYDELVHTPGAFAALIDERVD